MASSKGLPAGGHRGGAGTRWGQAGGVVLALGFTAGTGALASRWLWQTGRAGGRSTAGRAGGGGREGAAEWGGRGAAEGLRWRVCGRRRVGRELDGGGRGEHDGVGREEGAWGGARRRREGREVDGGASGEGVEWGGMEKWPEPARGLSILRPVCRVSARYDTRQRF